MALKETVSRPRSPRQRVATLAELLADVGVSCELELPTGEKIRIGTAPPAFHAVFRNEAALQVPFTELGLGSAYVEGDIDIEGDMLAVFNLRDRVRYGLALSQQLQFA